MTRYIAALLVMVAGAVFLSAPAHAVGLKVAPLEYRTSLVKGESKKGFVDISNPTSQKLTIKTSAQAFRQTDNQGTIQFYDSEQISAGVRLDLDEFELGPREAVRMYFLLDGTKLPTGDVYGAIFFTTTPSKPTAGVGQSVKLGTLLSLVNGTPGPRNAELKELDVPLLSFSNEVQGSYAIKNLADPRQATGFYPQVRLAASPFGESKETSGKLVFAGRTRTNDFTIKTPPIGVYRVSASYGDSSASRWVIVAHPGVLAVLLIAFVLLETGRRLLKRRKPVSLGRRF